jgi:hypothetical protein
MGLEPLIWGLWVIQAVAALGLAFFTASFRRWFAATGSIIGVAIGLSPFVVPFAVPFIVMKGQAPAIWGPVILIVIVSTVALTIAYGIGRRWLPLIATLLIFVIPLSYKLFVYGTYPPASYPTLLLPIAFIGEITLLLGPIICALACREIFGWLDFVVARRRAVT